MKSLKTIDKKIKNGIYPLVTLFILILVWELTIDMLKIPSYLIPSPSDILIEFKEDWQILLMHSKVTLIETILGLIISVLLALFIGTLMDFVTIIKKSLYPLMYVTQMIPTITIAPLLVIWFGFGIKSKVLLVVLTCFFPILVNFTDGIDKIDQDFLNMFRLMKSSRLKTFIHLKFPMALGDFFTGLKISSTYAFIAATVAEWLGGASGLGVYMVRAKSSYALDKVFACTILVVLFSLIFVGAINILRDIVIRSNHEH
ncbi:ABC transporter permease [Peptostreptococcus sp. D1]|uniref:ABC transporter permease n=1 Tax=Peptostreptococcus sp. D1 TaxID=72304 RepID=UPI0008EB6A49|nr:ABC transporter permease [Peptostreptococcus sp. D1]SFE45262.1 ABC-type nitrate/sulfonate/bicarbonate transport system, permease component [Peptostreptococcus sp. D1]